MKAGNEPKTDPKPYSGDTKIGTPPSHEGAEGSSSLGGVDARADRLSGPASSRKTGTTSGTALQKAMSGTLTVIKKGRKLTSAKGGALSRIRAAKPLAVRDLPPITARLKTRRFRALLVALSFLICVVLPSLVICYYYAFVASDQYVVETQFSVRGSSGGSLSDLGLSIIPGASTQSNDSYVVTGYIVSRQVIGDILAKHGVDIREFYSKETIDPIYRIERDMPFETFEAYWQDMIAVEFNSTTGNSTLDVTAFSADDARKISELILSVSEDLVNELSADSRRRMIEVARQELQRAQERLDNTRQQMTDLRNREQAVDPSQIASVETGIVSALESQLADLNIRRRALVGSIDVDTPSVRVLDRQVAALEAQLAEQRQRVGTGSAVAPGEDAGRLSELVSEYTELTLDQEFATTLYTQALGSVEKAIADARQQQRYFATFVYPYTPDAALYPQRILLSLLGFGILTLLWMIGYYVVRSVVEQVS